jgi:hypothetical protein
MVRPFQAVPYFGWPEANAAALRTFKAFAERSGSNPSETLRIAQGYTPSIRWRVFVLRLFDDRYDLLPQRGDIVVPVRQKRSRIGKNEQILKCKKCL